MNGLLAILRIIEQASFESGGAIICLPAIAIYGVLREPVRRRIEGFTSYHHDYVAVAFLWIFLFCGILYLVYPNYLDHVESTIAVLGHVLARGDALYPMPDEYPYHGIIYGPALAEIQEIFQTARINTMFSSKMPGVIAFACTIFILLRLNRLSFARGYLLYLTPYALMLFWDRGEPFLLLLVSSGLLLGENGNLRKYRPLLFGILAGAASAIKLHAALYVLSAYLAVTLAEGVALSSLLMFGIASAISFLTFFAPGNVSLLSFVQYVKLAGHHGLTLSLWLTNAGFLVFLLFPVVAVARGGKTTAAVKRNLALIVAIELIVTVVGAKPGAGPHHLLPFIPVNAFLIQRLHPGIPVAADRLTKFIYASLLIPGVLAICWLVPTMVKHWSEFGLARSEISRFELQYPDLVMGVSDLKEYPYTYLRALLRSPQIDYSAFMDLAFSGVRDDELVRALDTCKIEHLLMPNQGAPLSVTNLYNDLPLFSNDVRRAFAVHYSLEATGKILSVYTCR